MISEQILIKTNQSNQHKDIYRSKDQTNLKRTKSFENLCKLIDQSLKETNEYRLKYSSIVHEQFFNEHSKKIQSMENKSLFKFPLKPTLPNELIGKFTEKKLISNSDLDQTNDMKRFIDQYQINNSLDRINRKERLSIDLVKHFDEYSKYFNNLFQEYFHSNDIYENIQSKICCLALSEQIKDFFKEFSSRYKILVCISICEQLDQSIFIGSKSLWDQAFDFDLHQYFSQRNLRLLINVFFIYKH